MNATAQIEPLQPAQPSRWGGRATPQERSTHLAAVSSRARRRAKPRLFYASVTVATVLAIVVTQLLLSIGVSQGAYQIGGLNSANAALQRSLQAASEAVDTLSSPQNLAANANALGMVSNGTPVYLRLSDGAVLGSPAPASAAAGAVTGPSGNLVPNALLAGVPLAGQPITGHGPAAATSGSAAKTAATPAANATPTPSGPVALNGALPSPTTH
ncbi:hypothetical protein [Rathayibacter soli]|uniref:hypothetical protein n=1 Tax=Rathayibacter soli TaxID=3144168 RepID=UPI0027E579F4|nr:hypothetical protein [Glaciibacter superstes]